MLNVDPVMPPRSAVIPDPVGAIPFYDNYDYNEHSFDSWQYLGLWSIVYTILTLNTILTLSTLNGINKILKDKI